MNKKFSLLLLISIFSTLSINATVYSGSCGTNVRYSLDTSTGLLSITGTGAMTNYNSYPESNRAPWYSNRSYIKTVEISDGVTSIGSEAFLGCSGLTSVTIGNSVTSIGSEAFLGCSGLTSVTIHNSVTSIGDYAFRDCYKLTSVIIPNSVTSIGDNAFYNCSGLTQVTLNSNDIVSKSYSSSSTLGNIFGSQVKEFILGDDVTSIGSYAFYNYCSNVTSVTIADNVTSVGEKAFDGTAWYNNLPDGLFYAGKVAYKYKGTMPANTSMIIKEGTVELNDGVFDGCTGLTSLYIPGSVKTIENNAFANCTELLDVYCYARKSPTMGTKVFDNSGIQFATLYVPEASLNGYKVAEPWSGFGDIKALSGEYPEIPEITKCATPTIIFENGKLSFSCETEGARFVCNFSTPSESYEEGVAVNMPNKLQVSVYAKKDGFDNSDVATKEIDLGTSGLRGDVNNDGTVNMPDAMFIVNKILNGKFPDETPTIEPSDTIPVPHWNPDEDDEKPNDNNPTDLTAYIQLPDSIRAYSSNADELAAFCGNECRGDGTFVDGVWCIRIWGNVGDNITLKYYCATNRYMYHSAEPIVLKNDEHLGTYDEPRIVNFILDNSTR